MAKTKRKAGMATVGINGDAKRLRTSTGISPDESPLPPLPPSPPATDLENVLTSADENHPEALNGSSSSIPDRPQSGFERLPGEMRNLIYHHCLLANKTIIPRVRELPREGSRYPRNSTGGAVFGLALGTSRSICREVLTFFYGKNKFGLSIPYHKAWVNRIGRRNSACIRAITIHCEAREKQAENYLKEMQNALTKRFPDLRIIEYNCDWFALDNQQFFRRITAKHMARTWKYFKHLEMINLQHFSLPTNIRDSSPTWELLVKLCKQTKVRVVATHRQNILLTDRAAADWKKGKVVRGSISEEDRRD
ncbi:hypothetical protein QBC41DRAFT_266729 [Cercophora samala]|uniref:Uncharacterized protein n=1 Tax=Cercophora samala TaxID=330535 RepID=A0AA40DG51_9PEZI|nr:hypothetical protein QBC41DRAFT_266729 [Cercophora samala]